MLYFLEQFQKCEEVTYLKEPQSSCLSSRRKTFVMDNHRTHRITAYAQEKSTSAFMLFSTALATYMSRVRRNAEAFYLGTAVLNRSGIKELNTVGMFVNTAPMLMEIDSNKSFGETLSTVQERAFSVFRHQKFNYGEVLSAIRKEFNFTEKLYDVLISYQNATIGAENVETTWYHSGEQGESLQIHIDDRDREGIFRIHYDYQTQKFTEEDIDRLHLHLCNLLFDGIGQEDKKLCDLELLSKEEAKKLLCEFNHTQTEYPKYKCIHRLFEEQVAKAPNKIALIACDKTLSYKELNERANRIAHRLMELGVGVGDLVAFELPRTGDLFAVMLGILKAGGAYLPIDPEYPRDRISYMLSDSHSKLCITEETLPSLLSCQKTENPAIQVDSTNLCYCIYTSGSTGQPKGTLLTHRNVVNYVDDNGFNVYHKIVKPHYKRIVSVTTVGFDIFVTESLLPLTKGIEIVFANEEQAKFQGKLNALLQSYPVDVLQTTPTKMKTFIADGEQTAYLQDLKAIVLGGEALDQALAEKLSHITDAKLFNIYGPTETTVWSTLTEVKKGESIHIGKPIANTQIYIVDKYMKAVPIGVTGELCIAGDGVGRGYLGRPELTVERFANNPFGPGKLYKTGDLAYWQEDGTIAYVGRNDFQVKIRGLRIELGEIENALCAIEGISQAVVVVRKNTEGRQLICGFYTGAKLDTKEIRKSLEKKLPKYMLPHLYARLPAMPLTGSGKINRKALPEIDLAMIGKDMEYVAPKTPMEKTLCHLMEEVLGMSSVGTREDFFDLGGDSLKAIEFVTKAHTEGIYFTLQNVFDYPSVAELCDSMGTNRKTGVSFEDTDFTAHHRMLENNTLQHITVPEKCPVGNILLSGATGYLGIHILGDFLEHDHGIAYCLVRGKDKAHSTKRLQELLDFYFGNKYAHTDRIEVICADLQQEEFGLAEEEYRRLINSTDTVVNCAASVKHYGSYQYFYESNVESVKGLIRFCKEAKAKLIHTSTISVSGNSFADDFTGTQSQEVMHFYEKDLYIGQPLENVYAHSKFEGEKLVIEAMCEGLPANIMRMGNLTNRVSDGQFQKNHESNAFLKRLRAVLELGVVPDYLMPLYVEFTPVDEAAHGVMTITRHFHRSQNVFHMNSHKVVYMDQLLNLLHTLELKLKTVSGREFTEALRRTAGDAGTPGIFETFINDMDENDQLNYESNIRFENGFTVEYLKKLGFEWSDIGIDYLEKYLRYFRKIGYLQ